METVFVERGEDGLVKGVYRQRQDGYAEEELAADHADVQDFQKRVAELVARNKKGGA